MALEAPKRIRPEWRRPVSGGEGGGWGLRIWDTARRSHTVAGAHPPPFILRATLTLPTLSTGEATGEATTVVRCSVPEPQTPPIRPIRLFLEELFRKLVGI